MRVRSLPVRGPSHFHTNLTWCHRVHIFETSSTSQKILMQHWCLLHECFDTGTVIYQPGWNCCEGVGIGVDINGLTWSGHFWRSWRSITDAHGSLTERTSNQPMKLRVLKPIVIPPYKIVSNAFHQRTPIKLHHLCWQQMSKMLSIRSSNLMYSQHPFIP